MLPALAADLEVERRVGRASGGQQQSRRSRTPAVAAGYGRRKTVIDHTALTDSTIIEGESCFLGRDWTYSRVRTPHIMRTGRRHSVLIDITTASCCLRTFARAIANVETSSLP